MLSLVIPVYNEAKSLETLHQEIDQIAPATGHEVEVIFIDDGSQDGSWEVIQRLAAKDPRVRGIRFRRNFGKAAALNAGFGDARGELIMTLDADLQDDPREIPRFIEAMNGDVAVVSGWKKVRHDPWHKVIPSRIFNWMVSRTMGVKLHDHNCGMKCYRREVFAEVRLYGELHRFVPVLAAAKGFRVGELVIAHRARQFGHSKYGPRRFVKGFLDLLTVKFLTNFAHRPQHMLGSVGLASFLLGALGLTYLAAAWFVTRLGIPGLEPIFLGGRPMVLYLLAMLLFGGQLLSIGILGELITAYHEFRIPTYSVSDRTKPRQSDHPGVSAGSNLPPTDSSPSHP
jgi:glycosyltransferase involved in cell wall biosynthesis